MQNESIAATARRAWDKLTTNILERRLRDHLADLYSGDIEAALDNCDDDVDYISSVPTGIPPHLCHRRGKAETAATWRTVADRYPKMRHEIRSIVADTNGAAVIINVPSHKHDSDRVV
jgi:hypothetical protein